MTIRFALAPPVLAPPLVSFVNTSFQDFKMFYDVKFGRKKEISDKDAGANGHANGVAVTNGSGALNRNGRVRNTSDMAVYEQYSNCLLFVFQATKLYCFVHKVPVCGECVCFPEHQICVAAMQGFTQKIVQMMESERLFESQGGPIILSQIKNEYDSERYALGAAGASYINWAAKMALGLDTGVPWVMCKEDDAPDPIINACNGFYCDAISLNKPYN